MFAILNPSESCGEVEKVQYESKYRPSVMMSSSVLCLPCKTKEGGLQGNVREQNLGALPNWQAQLECWPV